MSRTKDVSDPAAASVFNAPEETHLADKLSTAMILQVSKMLESTAPVSRRPGTADRLTTKEGLSATLAHSGTAVAVRDARGHLIFELHDDGSATLSAPSGDLELRSTEGKVRLTSEKGVELRSPTVDVAAHHFRVRATYVETTARRAVERFQDFYQNVERVAEVRANDIRLSAHRTILTLAKKLRMRADEDAKIQAEKVYLG